MNLVMTSTPLAVVGCGFTQNNAADVVSAHVLAMFISNVTPAIIVAGAAGFGFGLLAVPLLLWSGMTLPQAVAVTIAAALVQSETEGLRNFSVLSMHKLTPPAMSAMIATTISNSIRVNPLAFRFISIGLLSGPRRQTATSMPRPTLAIKKPINHYISTI